MGMHRVGVLAAVTLTLFTSLPVAAATTSVAAGGNLQAAIDNASAGDTILLQAGATFTGNFVVRSGKQSLTIRSSAADALLPVSGQRTSPQYAPYLPKLQSPNSGAALTIEPGASYITLLHLELLQSANGSSSLIELGYVDSRQTSAAQAPHHLVLDRLLVAIPSAIGQKRAVALNSGATQVLGCYLAGLKFAGADAQAIAGWNGPGPFVIENNYLEGAGENLMFGGSDPTIPALVPTNIQIRRNHLAKPIAWKGTSWTVKNILELKNAQDVVIEGNLLEYNWAAAQTGYSVVFTPRNQYGGNPGTVVQRVTFRNNKVRHVSSVFNILGRDTNYPSQLTNDIEIRNNVFEDVSKATYGGTGRMMLIDGGDNIRVRNNTSFNSGTALYGYGHAATNFVFENNIVNYGDYGIMGDNTGPGNSTLATWFPSAVVLGNVMPNNTQPWTFPAGNAYPANWAAVGFINLAGGNYRLASTSAYIVAGTGGSTPGADIDALEAAMVSSAAVVACTFTVTPLSHDSPAGGDTFNVGVTASAPSCSWTTASDQPWATASVAGGTGSGTLMLTVGANGTSTQRTATLTVAGSAVAITQDPPPACSFTVSPSSHDSPSGGDSFSVSVTASASACSWTASSNQPWATASAAGGTGSATLTLMVGANGTSTSRTANVTVAGHAVAITEAAAVAPPACMFTLSPSSITVAGAGTTFTATLTASDASCGWSAGSNVAWITLSSLKGTGSATVSVTVAANTTNGTRTGTINAGGQMLTVQQLVRIGPDLLVTALAAPANAAAGSAIAVSDTTSNNGGGSAGASVTRFYLSTNATFDAGDVLLGSRTVGPLAAAASSAVSSSLTIPANTAGGAYYIIAKADANADVVETSESNNNRQSGQIAIGPDLTVADLTAPPTVGAGALITLSDTTKNQGAGSAAASQTSFYFSTNSLFDAADVLLGSRPVPVLGTGAVSSASTTLTIPAGTASGTYYVVARADAAGVVPEGNESNNTRAASIRVGADLTIAAVTAPASGAAGSPIAISDTTTNTGGGAAAASVTRFHLSANTVLDAGDTALGSRAVPALSGGASDTASSLMTIPATTTGGAYYVIAQADADATVAETSEANNIRVSGLVRIGADLVVSVAVPPPAGAGGSVLLTDTTKNQGAAAAGGTDTAYYLSSNAVLDAADVLLGTRLVPALESECGAYGVDARAGSSLDPDRHLLPVCDGRRGRSHRRRQ